LYTCKVGGLPRGKPPFQPRPSVKFVKSVVQETADLRVISALEPTVSVAPLGLVIRGNAGPTAHAVGYCLSALRA